MSDFETHTPDQPEPVAPTVPAPPAPPAQPAPPAYAQQQPGYAPQPPAYAPQPPAAGGPSYAPGVIPDAKELGRLSAKVSPFAQPVPQPWMAPYVGPNGLPEGVSGFNWGAFLLGFWWPLIYGLNLWAVVALGVAIFGNILSRYVPTPVGLLISLAQLGFLVWMGLSVNRAYWSVNSKQLTVAEFKSKQVKWIVIGVVVFAVVVVIVGLGALALAAFVS